MRFQELKTELKEIAFEIRKRKQAIRCKPNAGWKEWSELWVAKHDFRHKHIAYCLLRGRTYEQIEGKLVDAKAPDMNWVQTIMEAHRDKAVCACAG